MAGEGRADLPAIFSDLSFSGPATKCQNDNTKMDDLGMSKSQTLASTVFTAAHYVQKAFLTLQPEGITCCCDKGPT
jgi:hypothetical protein